MDLNLLPGKAYVAVHCYAATMLPHGATTKLG